MDSLTNAKKYSISTIFWNRLPIKISSESMPVLNTKIISICWWKIYKEWTWKNIFKKHRWKENSWVISWPKLHWLWIDSGKLILSTRMSLLTISWSLKLTRLVARQPSTFIHLLISGWHKKFLKENPLLPMILKGLGNSLLLR